MVTHQLLNWQKSLFSKCHNMWRQSENENIFFASFRMNRVTFHQCCMLHITQAVAHLLSEHYLFYLLIFVLVTMSQLVWGNRLCICTVVISNTEMCMFNSSLGPMSHGVGWLSFDIPPDWQGRNTWHHAPHLPLKSQWRVGKEKSVFSCDIRLKKSLFILQWRQAVIA